MIRRKSTESDEQLIYDESVRSVDRVGAISRLAVDGYAEMESLLVKLLDSEDYLLRDQAIRILLGGWGQSKYLEKVIGILHHSSDEFVRMSAANSLGSFVVTFEVGQKHKERVLRELLEQLLNDEDLFAQKRCYEQIVKIIKNQRVGEDLPNLFDRERDVDWNLLQPYLEEYNLRKPS